MQSMLKFVVKFVEVQLASTDGVIPQALGQWESFHQPVLPPHPLPFPEIHPALHKHPYRALLLSALNC